MMLPKPKYVIFICFLLRPDFSTKISGLPDFYSVKLDVIGFAQKPYFCDQGTSYINTLYLFSHELFDLYLKLIKMTRGVSAAAVATGQTGRQAGSRGGSRRRSEREIL